MILAPAMFLALFLAALLTQAASPDPTDQHLVIPASYQGTWAIDGQCEDGPAQVSISSRQIDFYERHGYLRLGTVNANVDPATFYGEFDFVSGLKFGDEVVRLDVIDGDLVITENPSDDARKISPSRWRRCS